VIRTADGGGRLLGESSVPTEAELHGALMEHPALVPAADLGFDRMVAVGFEASLASGSADLVLLDARGQLCVCVEVKK
jgi:RecB family endonuclease NucS